MPQVNKKGDKKSDFFELDESYVPKNSIIFISNLLFPEETNQKLIKLLGEITPAETIIIVSKIPDNLYSLKLIEKLTTPMSWSADSSSYILKNEK